MKSSYLYTRIKLLAKIEEAINLEKKINLLVELDRLEKSHNHRAGPNAILPSNINVADRAHKTSPPEECAAAQLAKQKEIRQEYEQRRLNEKMISDAFAHSKKDEFLKLLAENKTRNLDILIDISNISPMQFEIINAAIISPEHNIESLHIPSGYHTYETDSNIVTLANILMSGNCRISSLSLPFVRCSDGTLSDMAINALADLLRSTECHISKLCLSGHSISLDGIIRLFNASIVQNKLKSLDITRNTLTEQEKAYCLDMVAKNLESNLTDFFIGSGYGLSDVGINLLDKSIGRAQRNMLYLLCARQDKDNNKHKFKKLPEEMYRLISEMITDRRHIKIVPGLWPKVGKFKPS